MFMDKQKITREYLDEFTKIGNLFDTFNIGYCVVDRFALIANSINSKVNAPFSIIADAKNKDKVLRTLFKLNYVISSLTPEMVTITKPIKQGELAISICFGETNDKKISFKNGENNIILPQKIMTQERKEIITPKSGKGYFRVAPLEVLYFIRMNHNNPEYDEDLEMIKSSGKIDFDKLMKLFDLNGLA